MYVTANLKAGIRAFIPEEIKSFNPILFYSNNTRITFRYLHALAP